MTLPKPNSSGASGVTADSSYDLDFDQLERRAEQSPIAEWRERAIRNGDEPPLTSQEHVWAEEGRRARGENKVPFR